MSGSSARIPLIGLFIVLGLTGGTIGWLSVGSGAQPDQLVSGPIAEIALVTDPARTQKNGGTHGAKHNAVVNHKSRKQNHAASESKKHDTSRPPRDDHDANAPRHAETADAKRAGASGRRADARDVRLPAEPPLPSNFKLAKATSGPPLRAAPDPALVQRSAVGPLPKVATDGRKPWRVYARPFDLADKRPRIAIVITGLGLRRSAIEAAINALPGAVTLAFAPYADRLDGWIRKARASGHEILLDLPMEPINFPADDPGPQALLTSLPPSENQQRLLCSLGRVTGYVGITDFMGSRFTMSSRHLRPILTALNQRGLMFLDSRAAPRSRVADLAREIGLPWQRTRGLSITRRRRWRSTTGLRNSNGSPGRTASRLGWGHPFR